MFSDNKKLVSDDILYFVEHQYPDPYFEQIIVGRYVKITLLGSKDLRLYNWYKSLQNRNHLFRTDIGARKSCTTMNMHAEYM